MSKTIKKTISVVSALFALLFLFALLNRTGSLILTWKEEGLGTVTHDAGHAYYAFVPDENLSRLSLPFYLKEDDRFPDPGPLSVNEDITASIKEQGGGRYQLLANNDLYFSASDDRPEDHEYSVISPAIIRNRYLLLLFIPAAIMMTAEIFLCLRHKETAMIRDTVRILTAVFLILLLIPWNRLVFPAAPSAIGPLLIKPVLQRNVFFIGILFALLLIDVLMNGKSKFFGILSAAVLLLNLVYFFIPEWNWYGLRADSPAYLQSWSAASIRTPGYPAFISSVYSLSGDDGLNEIREIESVTDENLQDGSLTDSKGLLNVVRAQKCVLGLAFLIFFAVSCRFYDPVWFAFAAQIILCGSFLGADNSYIMTECLSQAAILIAAAMILLILKEKSFAAFILLCVISAAGILIRPANIFLAVPILICAVILIVSRKNILIPLLGGLIFLAISTIPAIAIFRQYGIFVWMPSSGFVEIARAAELMEPGDEEAFTDPESRDFCRDMLELKKQYPDADQNTNMWQVGIAAAQARGYDLITCSPLFGKVSRKIFMMHFREFTAALMENIKTALERTRLRFGPVSFPVLLLLFTLLFVIRISTDSLAGMLLALLHVIHLCLSMMNQPERRYIYSTEILCLLGWTLILINLISAGKKIRK